MMTTKIKSLFKITEVELIYRNKTKAAYRPSIPDTNTAADLFLASWDMNKIELIEECKILLLDRRSACIGLSNISSGGISSCIADPKIIFATALKARASSIILAHNHPSGNLRPSEADITMTDKFVRAGTFLDIDVLDHIILTSESHLSMAEEGMIVKRYNRFGL